MQHDIVHHEIEAFLLRDVRFANFSKTSSITSNSYHSLTKRKIKNIVIEF